MEKSYIAGLLDGEGSVMLSHHHVNEYRSPIVSICNNYLELLLPLKKQYAGTITPKKSQNPNHNSNYEWKISGRRAIKFLEEILPFMHHPVKIYRSNLIINQYISVTSRNGKYSEEQKKTKLKFEHDFFHPSTPLQLLKL